MVIFIAVHSGNIESIKKYLRKFIGKFDNNFKAGFPLRENKARLVWPFGLTDDGIHRQAVAA